MPVNVKVEQQQVQVELGELRAGVTDYTPLLKIAGNLMRGSVARTFRDEGSPAGIWPRLALSTLKKKGYTTGHKLLVMTGRLFGSIDYNAISGNTLTIGTNVKYAAVHQYGSADRGGGKQSQAAKYKAGSRSRNQDIPARPYLVVRPEDPARIAEGMTAYLIGRSRAAGGAL